MSPRWWPAPACWGRSRASRPVRSSSWRVLGVRGDPSSGWTVSTLGAALRRAGRPGDAAVQLDEAIRVNPGWPGTPLSAAMRELVRTPQDPGRPSDSNSKASKPDPSGPASRIALSTIQDQMARKKAPWHLRLEAELLARELEGPK